MRRTTSLAVASLSYHFNGQKSFCNSSRLAVSVSVINRVVKRAMFWRSMNFSMINLHETLLSAPNRMKKAPAVCEGTAGV